MSIRRVPTNTCDICEKEITANAKYVNAMSYGVTTHIACWDSLTANQLVKLLALDNIRETEDV